MPRRPIPRLSLPGSPAGLVLHETRVRGPLARAELAGAAGLSRATCARAVAALIDAGLLAELPPEADDGAAGRPVARVRCADPGWCHVGVHLGLRTTLAVVADATGRTLRVREEPLDLPRLGQEEALDRIAALARALADDAGRPVRTGGAALTGHVHPGGTVTSPAYGWNRAPLTDRLSAALGAPVAAAPHVAAMAAAELAATPLADVRPAAGDHGRGSVGASLYFYARETVGAAWTVGGAVHRPAHGDGTIGHLPPGPRLLLDGATLQEALGDSGVVAAARAHGLDAATPRELAELGRTRPLARRILDERADLLGRAVALVADVVDPGRVILAGAAFTDDPGALRHVAAALHRHSPVRRDVRVSRARGRITRDAAAAVALDALHADPLAVAAAPAPPDRPRSRPAPTPPPGRPRPAAARRTGVASPGTTKENHR